MSADELTGEARKELQQLAQRWWIFLISGVAWMFFAFFVLSFDFRTVWAVAVFFGVGFISGGLLELATARAVPSWKWLHVLFGVASIVAGIIALAWPGQTFLVLAAIIGWYVLVSGVIDVVTSFVTRRHDDLWWLTLIVGLAQVLIGFWAVGYAGRSIALLVVWVAATALARGISSIFIAFGLHGAGKELRRQAPASV
jgi:uncharacterized membrane protein HdeD (DUF308 family)